MYEEVETINLRNRIYQTLFKITLYKG